MNLNFVDHNNSQSLLLDQLIELDFDFVTHQQFGFDFMDVVVVVVVVVAAV